MFGFRKNKEKVLVAPVTGMVVPLEQVPDATFAQKVMGDGIAVECHGSEVVAPCAGELSMVSDTKHAFVVTSPEGAEILVHIGIDTVKLKGEGFVQLKAAGTTVVAGEPIIKVNCAFIQSKQLSLATPVVITNMEIVKKLEKTAMNEVTAGKSVIMKYST